MQKIKKIFGGIDLSWKKLIIFSLICAIYTALMMLLPFSKNTALKEIGVGFEMWFILAIFVVCNCKSTKEAAFKTFIFFLISQPLIYLIQQPFNEINLIKTYYGRWFILTLFTLPGGAIAYQIKKDNIFSAIILAVAGIFLVFMGFYYIFNYSQFSYIIYGLFLICSAILLNFIIFKNKKTKLIYLIILIISILIFGGYNLMNKKAGGSIDYELSNDDWYISYATYDGVESKIEYDVLIITYSKANAKASIILENSKGEKKELDVVIKKGEIDIDEIK